MPGGSIERVAVARRTREVLTATASGQPHPDSPRVAAASSHSAVENTMGAGRRGSRGMSIRVLVHLEVHGDNDPIEGN